jgi:DNA-binding NarL/FixJ family response regulator
VFSALQARARGFLTKDAGTDEIHRAILTVAAGEAQLEPSVQRRLLDAQSRGERLAVAASPNEPAPPDELTPPGEPAPPDELTPRQAEVLRDRAQLVGYAFRHGLASPQ